MTTTTTTAPLSTAQEDLGRRRDRWGRIILVLCAAGATIAAAASIGLVADAQGEAQAAETWRLAGLPVFAGLFLILARAPRAVAGLWELVIANKVALVVAGSTYLSDTDGGNEFVIVDGVLVVLLVAAYALSRGWTAWTTR